VPNEEVLARFVDRPVGGALALEPRGDSRGAASLSESVPIALKLAESDAQDI